MTPNHTRRVVVTGLGAVSNVGHDVPSMWHALKEGKSGVGMITAFEQNEEWTVNIAGEVRDYDFATRIDHRELKRMDRFCALGVCAAMEAAENCGIDFKQGDSWRRGVALGSGIGGISTIETGHIKLLQTGPRKISPFTVPRLMVNACAGTVSILYALRGACTVTSTACATGGHAIGAAFRAIRCDDADVMIAGGSEATVTPLCVGSFAAMKALSTRNNEPTLASRPFDKDRDGFVLSEGAGVVVLEELEHAKKRGAKIFAEVLGFGATGDAHHIAAPEPSGIGAQKAMEFALKDAKLNLDQVDYINAHGTSTPLGDAAEVNAVRNLFGDHAMKLAVSSTKSMTGHALGAAGGIESVAAVMAVHDSIMPPTINLDCPDEGFNLNFVPNVAQEKKLRAVLNNSFGFGGHNTCLVFGHYDGT